MLDGESHRKKTLHWREIELLAARCEESQRELKSLIATTGENEAVTVLVVEDEAIMRTKLAEELQDAGYLVVEASDGTEAIEILAVRQDVKIVISDVRMPGPIDGVELCRRVRSGYPEIKVVLSSGEPNAADSTAHDGFFLKPYRVARIISHIRSFTD